MYKSKFLHTYSILRLLILIPIIIFAVWLIFILVEPYLDIKYHGLDFNLNFYDKMSVGELLGFSLFIGIMILFLILVPLLLLWSNAIVHINRNTIYIKRPFLFWQKTIMMTYFKGYSISYNASSTNIVGLINFYSPNGNFRISSMEVNNLSELHRIIKLTDIPFLGYEPQRFYWSLKRFGQRKYMFEDELFTSIGKEASNYHELLNPPNLKSLFWFSPILLILIVLFLAAPITDIVKRQNSYNLSHFGETSYGMYFKCVPQVYVKGSIAVKTVKSYYGYTVNDKKFTGYKKLSGEKCPPQNSKIKLIYYTKNPKVHRTLE